MPFRFLPFLLTVLFTWPPLRSRAEKADTDKPRWEAGLAAGIARVPEYPGSDQSRIFALPLPFFIYRGEVLEAGERNLAGVLLRTDRVEAKLSLAGHPPVNDEGNREGMRDLPLLLEAGLVLCAFAVNTPRHSLSVQGALREGFSLDFGADDYRAEGPRAVGLLAWRDEAVGGNPRWRVGSRLGVQWVGQGLADFFYSVRAGEETPERPLHRAEGGYAGAFASQSVSWYAHDRLHLSAFVRYHNLDGVGFDESPLVRDRHNFYVGMGLVWTLAQSRERVRR